MSLVLIDYYCRLLMCLKTRIFRARKSPQLFLQNLTLSCTRLQFLLLHQLQARRTDNYILILVPPIFYLQFWYQARLRLPKVVWLGRKKTVRITLSWYFFCLYSHQEFFGISWWGYKHFISCQSLRNKFPLLTSCSLIYLQHHSYFCLDLINQAFLRRYPRIYRTVAGHFLYRVWHCAVYSEAQSEVFLFLWLTDQLFRLRPL